MMNYCLFQSLVSLKIFAEFVCTDWLLFKVKKITEGNFLYLKDEALQWTCVFYHLKPSKSGVSPITRKNTYLKGNFLK